MKNSNILPKIVNQKEKEQISKLNKDKEQLSKITLNKSNTKKNNQDIQQSLGEIVEKELDDVIDQENENQYKNLQGVKLKSKRKNSEDRYLEIKEKYNQEINDIFDITKKQSVNNQLKIEDNDNDTKNPLIIRAKLLNTEDQDKITDNHNKKLNPLAEINFKAGGNGLLQVEPKVVIFKGFEIGKKYELTLKVINMSKFPQRISFISPTTQNFKAKFSRGGLISCGLSETVVVYFYPNKYEYFQDFIQVYGEENEKLIVPIEAYPVMNINKYPKYVPKYISFDGIMINHTAEKILSFYNQIEDGSFEYEFVPIKTCPEITLNPIYSEVKAKTEVQVKIVFNPMKYGTFLSEYEFRLSEYNFEPVKVAISGVCKVFDKSKLDFDEIRANNDNIANDYKESSLSKMRSVNYRLKPKEKIEVEEKKEQKKIDPYEYLKRLILEKEKSFLDYYNYCDGIIRDKEIKYKKFIGLELLTKNEIEQIKINKFNEYKQFNLFYQKISSLVYNFQKNSKITLNYFGRNFLLKPCFNINSNNNFFKNRKYLKIFLQALTKIVINKRANKKLSYLNKLLPTKDEENKDKIDELLINLNQDTSNITNANFKKVHFTNNKQIETPINNTDFDIKFSIPLFLNKPVISISDFKVDFSQQKVEYENNIFFDELKEFKPVDRVDQELLNYKDFKSTGISQYEITPDDIKRPCVNCFESCYFGEKGDWDFNFEKLGINPKDCQQLVKKDYQEKETTLFSQPQLRSYYNLNYYTETSLDWNLKDKNEMIKNIPLYSYQLDLVEKMGFDSVLHIKRRLKEDCCNFSI